MEKFKRIIIAICVMTSMSQTYGSVVEMTATPASVKPYMTPHLSVQCLLNDTGSSASGGLVGRDVTSSPMASTVDNVAFLTSLIIIKKDHGPIARITVATPAVIVGQLNNVTVTGDVTGASGVRGHLDLTWADPTDDVEGTYTCEVNALSSQGHSITLQKSVTVTADEPSIADIVKHMHSLEVSNREMTSTITQLKSENTQQQTLITQVESHNTQLESHITRVESHITQLESQIANGQRETTDLRHQLTLVSATSRHVETAEMACSDSTFYNGGTSYRFVDKPVTFAHAYDTPPAVIVSPVKVESYNSHNADFSVYLVSVTTTGFTVRCLTHGHSQIGTLNVRWMSVAK